ncbi:DUF5776 domain-containing protein [Secundilactobacillus kimchicus]|uniref:DUF5776 domain-containing protein n=1 Tax=Secundilactobacillus kimchicus TaxID=528209 RepID=UPI0024A7A859|nr:DUF5776 domain-containing protein [Secundilactobacillus kimchicus]
MISSAASTANSAASAASTARSTASSAASTAASHASVASSAAKVAASEAEKAKELTGLANSAAADAKTHADQGDQATADSSNDKANSLASAASSAASTAASQAAIAAGASSAASSAASVAVSAASTAAEQQAIATSASHVLDSAANAADAAAAAAAEEANRKKLTSVESQDAADGYHTVMTSHTIVTDHGLYRYDGATFSRAKKLEYIPTGTVLHVTDIVHNGDTTRFVLSDGSFITGLQSYSHFVTDVPAKYGNDNYRPGIWVVTSRKGIYEYSGKTFKSAKQIRNVKVGTVLHVKRVVKAGKTFRLYLTNGRYVTANRNLVAKKPVQARYYTGKLHGRTVTVTNAKGIFKYRSASLSKATRGQHVKRGTTLHVKRIVRTNNVTRFQLTDGTFVTAYTKFIKVH